MKRLTAISGSIVALAFAAAPALAASNPNGTGQPSQSCQAEPTGPPGLLSTTNGFATVAVNDVPSTAVTVWPLTFSAARAEPDPGAITRSATTSAIPTGLRIGVLPL